MFRDKAGRVTLLRRLYTSSSSVELETPFEPVFDFRSDSWNLNDRRCQTCVCVCVSDRTEKFPRGYTRPIQVSRNATSSLVTAKRPGGGCRISSGRQGATFPSFSYGKRKGFSVKKIASELELQQQLCLLSSS